MSTAFLPFTSDITTREVILKKLKESCKGISEENILELFLLICSSSVSSVRNLMDNVLGDSFKSRLAAVLIENAEYRITKRTTDRIKSLAQIINRFSPSGETFSNGQLWILCANSLDVIPQESEHVKNLDKIITDNLELQDLHLRGIFKDEGTPTVFYPKSQLEMYAFYCEYISDEELTPVKAILGEP